MDGLARELTDNPWWLVDNSILEDTVLFATQSIDPKVIIEREDRPLDTAVQK